MRKTTTKHSLNFECVLGNTLIRFRESWACFTHSSWEITGITFQALLSCTFSHVIAMPEWMGQGTVEQIAKMPSAIKLNRSRIWNEVRCTRTWHKTSLIIWCYWITLLIDEATIKEWHIQICHHQNWQGRFPSDMTPCRKCSSTVLGQTASVKGALDETTDTTLLWHLFIDAYHINI